MRQHSIKIIAALVMGSLLLTAFQCGSGWGQEEYDPSIVGDWQWTGTTVHHYNAYMGHDTTYSDAYPTYKDLIFYADHTVDVQQQGAHIPEDEPPYLSYSYNYRINPAGDTAYLTDPQGDYSPQAWAIKALTDGTLTLEYTHEGGDYAGIDVYTATTTYHRR